MAEKKEKKKKKKTYITPSEINYAVLQIQKILNTKI